MNLQSFTHLGFTTTELKLYISLAEVSKATAQQLSKITTIKRTTVYSALDTLMNKGLVTKERKGSTTFYRALKPEGIVRNIQEEKRQVQKKENLAKEFSELVSPLMQKNRIHTPRVSLAEGENGVLSFIKENTPQWRESMAGYDHTWWGYQDPTFVDRYYDWLKSYWEIKLPKERVYLLSNPSVTESELQGRVDGREIREVPMEFDFSSTIWICGDYIIMIMSRQDPNYITQIYDPIFSANLRILFQFIWNGLR